MSQRIIAVSDIHGYYEEFVQLMKKVNYQKGKDKLYILGDIVDRGPESIKLLLLLRNLQIQFPDTVKIIRGNHDDEFMKIAKILADGDSLDHESWEMYAGFTDDDLTCVMTFTSLFEKREQHQIVEWLQSLPLYIVDGQYIFTHAGINPDLPLEKQSQQVLLWGKDDVMPYMFIRKKAYSDKVVVFGHVSTTTMHKRIDGTDNDGIWFDCKNFDKIGIDCGIWNNGALAALIIHPQDKYEEFYIDCL